MNRRVHLSSHWQRDWLDAERHTGVCPVEELSRLGTRVLSSSLHSVVNCLVSCGQQKFVRWDDFRGGGPEDIPWGGLNCFEHGLTSFGHVHLPLNSCRSNAWKSLLRARIRPAKTHASSFPDIWPKSVVQISIWQTVLEIMRQTEISSKNSPCIRAGRSWRTMESTCPLLGCRWSSPRGNTAQCVARC